MTGMFRDRADAGRRLAALLDDLAVHRPVVLGVPRGGVSVAAEVAVALHAELDVLVVRKLGAPRQPELAIGAIGEGGARVVNDDVVAAAGVSLRQLGAVEERERLELVRRTEAYRAVAPPIDLDGRVCIVVDDGLATGATARASLEVLRSHGPQVVVLAVPVAPPDTLRALAELADQTIAVEVHDPFGAIGEWYEDFSQTSDQAVVAALRANREARSG
jgi:putative phosphoribosyl transferase